MRAFLSLLLLVASMAGSLAAEIRKGATMQVEANSIWFEEAEQLAQWQQKKKRGDAAAFKTYQENILREREAWQFINPVPVRILRYEPAKNRVYVKMKITGRMAGTEWFLDPSALRR
jgi:hypothetical protein